MKRLFIVSLLLFVFHAIDVNAADWYVRPDGGVYGSENGTDWRNAFDGFTGISWASVSCGDTIWVAGGIYTQHLVLQKKCTGWTRLYISRARSDAAECTGTAGWDAGFDSIIHQVNKGIRIWGDYDYITVSGRAAASGGNHGWWMDYSTATQGSAIEFINGSDADYNLFEYMDIQGPGYITYTSDGRGLDLTPHIPDGPISATGNIFSHLKIWNWETAVINVGVDNSTFEYLEMYDIGAINASTFHPNGIIIWSSSGGIVRYSKFYMGPNNHGVGEGIFFEQNGGCSNWMIYGNLFYNQVNNGKNIQISSPAPNLKIWNNTFYNNTFNAVQYTNSGACDSNGEFRNNLIISSGSGSCGTSSNNLTQSSPNPFVNSGSRDFHIVSTTGASYSRNKGYNLSASFTADRDGVTFGGDGVWDIGAFEFYFTDISRPSEPANLH